MVVRRRKKNVRQRGSHTHGWGSKKKHRGAGNRSGRGNAGRGKRSAHKKQQFIVRGILLGHRGFTTHHTPARRGKTINLEALERALEALVQRGAARKERDTYFIEAGTFPYAKILGSGPLHAKLHVASVSCSSKAAAKITAAGGTVADAVPASSASPPPATAPAAPPHGAAQQTKARPHKLRDNPKAQRDG